MDLTVWAVSLVGIILLTVLSDIILPDGQTRKYVKTVLSIVVVFVMLSPLPKLLSGDFSLGIFGSDDKLPAVQEKYLAQVREEKKEALKAEISARLEQNGYKNSLVTITSVEKAGTAQVTLTSVTVDVSKAVISSDKQNINKSEDIKSLLSKLYSIDKSAVGVLV